jgi:hypothetical protein
MEMVLAGINIAAVVSVAHEAAVAAEAAAAAAVVCHDIWLTKTPDLWL